MFSDVKENIEELVSVLMCVYNTPKEYLNESINSILNQTYHNLQFIIVNDGSDDEDTLNCLKYWENKDKRIVVINNEKNRGLTKSLNIGLEKCNGKYIARMDADDISCVDRIERQVRFMDENSDVSLSGTQIATFEKSINEAVYSAGNKRYLDEKKYNIAMLFDHFGPAHPTFILRNDFLKKNHIKYREEILKAQDYAIKVDILKAEGRIKILDEYLLYYRVHSGQITALENSEQCRFSKQVSAEYIKYRFPELNDSECEILATVRRPVHIYSYKVFEYVNALKKLSELNKKNKVYEAEMFNEEIMLRWKEKVVSTVLDFGGVKGILNLYTWKALLMTIGK